MLCGSHIRIWNLVNQMKKQSKKHQNILVKNWKLRVWCSLFDLVMWFVRFRILICESQSIWRKLLVLSRLYKHMRSGKDLFSFSSFRAYLIWVGCLTWFVWGGCLWKWKIFLFWHHNLFLVYFILGQKCLFILDVLNKNKAKN